MFSSGTQIIAVERLPIYENNTVCYYFKKKQKNKEIQFCMDLLGALHKDDGENFINTLDFSTSSYVYCILV